MMAPETRQQVDGGLFRSALLSSEAWLRKANDLLETAAVLEYRVRAVWEERRGFSPPTAHAYSDSGVLDVHLLIVAFGIEGLLKSAVVRTRRDSLAVEFDRSAKLPRVLHTHDLVRLGHLAGFQTCLEEEGLLRRLTRVATWSGRYPLPVSVEDRSSGGTFSDRKRYPLAYHWPHDVDHLNALIARMRRELSR